MLPSITSNFGTYNNDACYDAQHIFEVYRRLKTDTEYDMHFATDGHGGSGSMSCGFSDWSIEELFKFTEQLPEITFTFYNQNFDFTSMDIIVIKDHVILEQHSFDMEHEAKKGDTVFTKYGLSFVKNVTVEVEDEVPDKKEDTAMKHDRRRRRRR